MSSKTTDKPTTTTQEAAPDPRVGGYITVPGDQFAQHTRDYPEDVRDAVAWLYGLAKDQGWGWQQLASESGISQTTLYRVFTGSYGARLENVARRIGSFRRLWESRATMRTIPFVETSVARTIFSACEWALTSQSLTFIFGDSQIGKTHALEEFARRRNHGTTRYVRMPASGGKQRMVKYIGAACHIGLRTSTDTVLDRIFATIDDRQVLVVDEAHQVFMSHRRDSAVACLETLREIHDRTRCGLVICATNVLRDEMQTGAHAKMLEQFRRRGVAQIQLPAIAPREDIEAIAEAFGLEPAEGEAQELQDAIVRSHGLGRFVKYLQAASRYASKRKQKLAWRHFLESHAILTNLSA